MRSIDWYSNFGKRILDLLLITMGSVLILPLVTLVALLVRLKLGSPVFFRQERPGLAGKPFIILKFRTMTDARDAQGNLLPDIERLTSLGRLLRSASLDELPAILNVFRGEMSLVGPRPLLIRYLPYFSERERERFTVLPGITGWAQINGRNDLPWDNRLACDVWYVENMSWKLDLKIMWRTIFKVVQRENVRVAPRETLLDLDEERRRPSPSP